MEINQRYIDKLEKHIDVLTESTKYSLERFDILIISLSTSILILSIGFIKNLVDNIECVNTSLLQFSWSFFTTALISNLFSQVTAYYANKTGITVSINIIRSERGKSPRIDIQRKSKIEKRLNNLTMMLNGISLLALILGIILLMIFIFKNI